MGKTWSFTTDYIYQYFVSVVILQNKYKANYPCSNAPVLLIQSEYDNHK